jgi:hypothetical protein
MTTADLPPSGPSLGGGSVPCYVAGLLDRLGFFLVLLIVAEAARRVMT